MLMLFSIIVRNLTFRNILVVPVMLLETVGAASSNKTEYIRVVVLLSLLSSVG